MHVDVQAQVQEKACGTHVGELTVHFLELGVELLVCLTVDVLEVVVVLDVVAPSAGVVLGVQAVHLKHGVLKEFGIPVHAVRLQATGEIVEDHLGSCGSFVW